MYRSLPENTSLNLLKSMSHHEGPRGEPTESSCTSIAQSSGGCDNFVGLGLIMQLGDKPAVFSATSTMDTSSQILDIILEHAIKKFDDSQARQHAGRERFLSVINRFVKAGDRIEACLPAFPFKSANKVYKVLGALPDKAEELALQRLNGMCLRIKKIYRPGANITIISDGITYNGMFG